MKKTIRVGVIGTGAISDIYLQNMINRYEHLTVTGIASRHRENAERKASKYGIRAFSVRELLGNPDIDMVVNLTPLGAHYDLIRDSLLAGKHVYTEKTLADTPQRAKELMELAVDRGLYLGCAPDTFLGAALQTARKALDEGMVGTVTSFSATVNRDADVLTSLFYFLHEKGADVAMDYGVYYVTALISLLGPAAEAAAFTRAPYPIRKNIMECSPHFGEEMTTPNETILSALLRLRSGVTGTIHIDEESVFQEQVHMVIYGTEGMLYLVNADYFGGEIRLLRNTHPESFTPDVPVTIEVLPPANQYTQNSRGIGPEEMACAILEGRESRMDAKLAYHVLEVLDALRRSGQEHVFRQIISECDIPAAFY